MGLPYLVSIKASALLVFPNLNPPNSSTYLVTFQKTPGRCHLSKSQPPIGNRKYDTVRVPEVELPSLAVANLHCKVCWVELHVVQWIYLVELNNRELKVEKGELTN